MVPKIGGTIIAGGGTATAHCNAAIFRLHYVTATVENTQTRTRDMHGTIWERTRGRPRRPRRPRSKKWEKQAP
jgi:hypothetical protein